MYLLITKVKYNTNCEKNACQVYDFFHKFVVHTYIDICMKSSEVPKVP